MPLTAGTRLGPYEILAPLGAGGMGEVYRARDPRLGREVALKVLPPAVADDPSRRHRFEQEARAVAALNHPNIVAIHDIGEDRGVSYIVTELVDGESLRGATFNLRKLLDAAAQISGGLAAAHAAGIVHRDLKPENVMVTREGRVKILDFGLAKVMEARQDPSGATRTMAIETQPGMVMGTVAYMSPEQARGQALDPRTDIFSLGTVLYELASGKHPFPGPSVADVMSAILKEDPPPLEGEISPALERIVRRCLEKEPERRFQSAADLAFALESVGGVSSAAAPVAASPKPTRRTALWAGGVAAAGALGFGAARWLRPGGTRTPRYRVISTAGELVSSAVIHPDGKSVVYAAQLDGKPAVFQQDIFQPDVDGGPPRMLPLPAGAQPLSLSVRGELAFLVGSTLFRTPLSAIAPRAVLENVLYANWSGDGESLQVERRVGNKYQVEFPAGHVIHESEQLLVGLALAPRSGRSSFAMFDHELPRVLAVDTSGQVEKLYEVKRNLIWDTGAVWSPDEREVWRSTIDGTDPSALVGYSAKQKQRLVLRLPGEIGIRGISAAGALLLTLKWNDRSARSVAADGSEIPIAMAARPSAFSPDGAALALASGTTADPETYCQRSNGGAPVLLGKGLPAAISPDGKWVVVFRRTSGYVLMPTGPGQEQNVIVPGITGPRILGWQGDRWLVVGHETARGPAVHVFLLFDPAGGAKQKLKLEITGEPARILTSPDSTRVLFSDYLGKWSWAEVDGAPPSPLAGLTGEVYGWTADGRELYVGHPTSSKLKVERYDIATGSRTPWKEFDSGRPDVTIGSFAVTPDGRAWAYALNRTYTRLVLVEGLR